jgi:NhaP-type Na+/H+ or K+/H+ antiporter
LTFQYVLLQFIIPMLVGLLAGGAFGFLLAAIQNAFDRRR